MSHRVVPLLVVFSFMVGCEGAKFGAREGGALGGAAVGAGLGAIIGNQFGAAGPGVAIGSAFGALAGGIAGNEIDRQDQEILSREEQIARQEQEIEENRRLLDELKRRGVDVRQTKRGVVVNLPDVLFEFDSARLTGSARSNVAEIARVMQREAGERRVSVEGHTDSVGSFEYNQRLSEQRAQSVAEELAGAGVPRRRLQTRGYGETDPVASNTSAAGRAKNRRVEVIIENR